MVHTVLNKLTGGKRWIYKRGPEGESTGDGDQGSKSGADRASDQSGDKKDGGQEPRSYDETYVKQLRDEAAGYRTRLKELENNSTKTTTQLQSDLQKVMAELDGLRKERQTATVMAAAQREGAKYPDAVALLIPADTKPEDLAAAIKALRKTHPDLFTYQDGDGGKKGEKPTEDVSPGMGTLRAAYAASVNKEK